MNHTKRNAMTLISGALVAGMLLAAPPTAGAKVLWQDKDVSTSGQNGETPTIAMSNDGNTLAYGWLRSDGTNPATIGRYSSAVDGTWPAAVQQSASGATAASPRVAMSGDGQTIAYTWTSDTGTGPIVQTRFSKDAGATWTGPTTRSAVDASDPRLAISDNGQVMALVWKRQKVTPAATVVEFILSTDGGTTWTSPKELSNDGQNAERPVVAVSSDGSAVVFAWEWFDGSHTIAQTQYSTNSGANWTTADLTAAGQNANNPQVAVNGDGSTIAYTWQRSNGSNTIVQARELTSAGLGTTTDLSAAGGNATAPQLAVNADATTIVYTWQRSNGSNTIVQGRYRGNGGTWTTADLSATGQDASQPRVAVGPDGKSVAFAWQRSNGSNTIIQTRYTTNATKEWTNADLSATGQNASLPQVVVGEGKTIAYTWQRSNGSNTIIQTNYSYQRFKPGKPSDVFAVPGDKQATLNWTAPTDDGGMPITGYRVQAQKNKGDWATLVKYTGSTATSYTATGLKNGAEYKFRVAAWNEIGRGGNAGSTLVTPTQAKPGKVKNLTVKWKKKKRKAVVKWQGPINKPAKKFQVRISKPNDIKVFRKWKKTGSRKWVYQDLKVGKKYKVQARGKNGKSKGPMKGLKFKTKKKQSKTFGPK